MGVLKVTKGSRGRREPGLPMVVERNQILHRATALALPTLNWSFQPGWDRDGDRDDIPANP